MAPVSPDLGLLGGRLYQHHWLYPSRLFFVAYFSTARAIKNAAATAILLGFLTSLMIEVLQAYLPTRDSGMHDLITNTLGTGLGVLLYRSSLFQTFMTKAFLKQASDLDHAGALKREFKS